MDHLAAVLLLGPLECRVGDKNVLLSGWRMSTVLAALALDAPAPVSRSRLITALWGTQAPTSAVNAVQVQISKLRGLMGQDLVHTVGDGYRLADTVQVDVRDFQAHLRAGQQALREDDPQMAEEVLATALALWRGPALAGVMAPGLEPEIRRLDDLRLDALQARLEADLALGRHAQVVGELRALVSSHPYDEGLRGLLMIALYRSGRQDEAFATYTQAVRVLADDLGVDPTPDLVELHRRLLQHDDHRPATTAVPHSHHPPVTHLTPRLEGRNASKVAVLRHVGPEPTIPAPIGRQAELQVLTSLAEQARQAGEVRIAVVAGDAGMGKSTLVQALVATVEGASVLRGECLDLGSGRLPYAPVVQALRPVLRDPTRWGLRLDSAARAALARLIPELATTATISSGGQGLEVGHTQLYEHLLGVVEHTADAAGLLVLVVEDIHFCDPATRDLLTFLVGNLVAGPVLMVLTARTDEVDRQHPARSLLNTLNRSARSTLLDLSPLGPAALAELVATHDPDRRTLEAVLERSGGNPLFALELAAGHGSVTDQLSDLLLARVERCDLQTQQVMRVLAASGTGLDHATLAALTGIPDSRLTSCVREAVAAQLLVVTSSGAYDVRHDLISEAIDSWLLPGEVVAIHGDLADRLASEGGLTGANAARLVRHLRAAGRPEEELEAAYAAGQQALEMFAYSNAQAMFQRVIHLWTDVPGAANRIDSDLAGVYETAAVCAISDLDHRAGVGFAEQALLNLESGAESDRTAHIHMLIGRGHDTDWALAEVAYRAALAALRPGDSPARAEVEAAVSTALMFQGQFSEAEELAEHAAEVGDRVGAMAEAAEALTTLGVIQGQRGRIAEAAQLFDRAQDAAEASGMIRHQIRCARSRSGILANHGVFEEAISECWRGIEIARRHGLDRTHGMHLRGNLLGPMIDAGRLDEAIEIGSEAVEMVPEGRPRATLLTHMGTAAVRRGDVDLALRWQEQAAATMGESKPTFFVAFWTQLAAEVAMARGEYDTALQQIQVGFAATTAPDGPAIWAAEVGALYGEVVLEGRLTNDLAPVLAAVKAAARNGETAVAAGERLRLEAIAVELAGAGHEVVVAGWQQALAAYEALPMPQRMARCHLALAELHLRMGDRSRARGSWVTATRLAQQIGAQPLAAAAEELGRRGNFVADAGRLRPA
ncbi:MAG: BTAD domain-containing putative transcriptional regulator [Euzebya sp.]